MSGFKFRASEVSQGMVGIFLMLAIKVMKRYCCVQRHNNVDFPFGNSLVCRCKNNTLLVIVFLKQVRCTSYIHVERECVGLGINAA